MAGQFWSSPDMEPKRVFRFLMSVGDLTFYLVKSAQRPNYQITDTKHKYLNHEFKFPGHVEWQDIDVTLVDPVDDNSMEKMKNIIAASGYTWMDPDSDLSPANLNTISKKRAVAALSIGQGKGVLLDQINADGDVIDRWTLQNAWIADVSPNENNYEGDDLSDITLTIKYDFAKLETFTR